MGIRKHNLALVKEFTTFKRSTEKLFIKTLHEISNSGLPILCIMYLSTADYLCQFPFHSLLKRCVFSKGRYRPEHNHIKTFEYTGQTMNF